MKCRIWYQPNFWQVFGTLNPAPWRLDIPANVYRGTPPVDTYHQTFAEALAAFQWLTQMNRQALRQSVVYSGHRSQHNEN